MEDAPPLGQDPTLDTPRQREVRIARQNSAGIGLFFVPIYGFFLLFFLYPIFDLAILIVIFVVDEMFGSSNPVADPDPMAWIKFLIPAIVVGFIAVRLEQWLGAHFKTYRLVRHCIRVLIVGFIVNRTARANMDLPDELNPFVLVVDMLTHPVLGAITLAAMFAMHFILMKWQLVREFWHQSLNFFLLRSRKLDESYDSRTIFGAAKRSGPPPVPAVKAVT